MDSIQITPDMNRRSIGFDQVRPISSFDISNDKELKEAFNWKNTQPLLKQVHQQKGTKYNFLVYQLQFPKAYQFLRFNKKGLNQKF